MHQDLRSFARASLFGLVMCVWSAQAAFAVPPGAEEGNGGRAYLAALGSHVEEDAERLRDQAAVSGDEQTADADNKDPGFRGPSTIEEGASALVPQAASPSTVDPSGSDRKPEDAEAANTTASDTSSGSNAVWIVLTFLSVLLAAASTGFAIWTFRWRLRLPDGQTSLVPEELINRISVLERHFVKLAQINESVVDEMEQSTARAQKKFSEISEAFAVFSEQSRVKDDEIRKLREGGEKQAIARDLHHFVRVLRYLERDIREDAAEGKDTSSLEETRELLAGAIASVGLQTFRPPLDSDFRTASNQVQDIYVERETDDPDKDWMIADVITEGFVLPQTDAPLVVERAKVAVYRFKQSGD